MRRNDHYGMIAKFFESNVSQEHFVNPEQQAEQNLARVSPQSARETAEE
jgi:hypothetical protein